MAWVRPKMQQEETSYDSQTMVIAFMMVKGLRYQSGKRWSRTFIEGQNLSSAGNFYFATQTKSNQSIHIYMLTQKVTSTMTITLQQRFPITRMLPGEPLWMH